MTTTESKAVEAFHLDRNAVFTLPAGVRASATVVTIIALFPLAACALISLLLLVRLGWDALTLSGTAYQESSTQLSYRFCWRDRSAILSVANVGCSSAGDRSGQPSKCRAQKSHYRNIYKVSRAPGSRSRYEDRCCRRHLNSPLVRTSESRLGALYSLERLLSESEKDQRAILETLCAYIRENSPC